MPGSGDSTWSWSGNLTASDAHSVHCVSGIQEMASLGIRFIATSQGLDTDESNPATKLLMHILAAVAQFERELIRERVSAGMKAAKARGTKTGNAIGRPRRVFDRDEVVRLRRTGLSFEKIAGQMRVGVGTVVRAIQRNGALFMMHRPCRLPRSAISG